MNPSKIAESDAFRTLQKSKKTFLLPLSLFFLAFYFALTMVSVSSATWESYGRDPTTWAWFFALAQFPMTWLICGIYARKARRFDRMVDAFRSETNVK